MRWTEIFDRVDLASAGWGVIFHRDVDPGVEEALRPLLNYRRQAAGDLYRRLIYLPGETKEDFLVRNGVGPGPVDPRYVPFYLLIVGDPVEIPFHVQFQLDVGYAVGRLCLPTPEAHANYAQTVIEQERRRRSLPRAAFFGVRNDDDRLTAIVMEHLMEPLSSAFRDPPTPWTVEVTAGSDATRSNLADLLGGDRTPDLLFTAGHGAYFPSGHELQVRHQGGLMCADWPGPAAWDGSIPSDFYFSVEDLGEASDLAGLVAFFFACYSAGTPKIGNYSTPDRPRQIASTDFIAGLPQGLLGHPRGALAVIGSVDRTHDETFLWEDKVQVRVFELTLRHLMRGDPVGLATEHIHRCAAELASDLLTAGYEHGLEIENERELHSRLWQAYQDARSYALLGDPAVRLEIVGSSSTR